MPEIRLVPMTREQRDKFAELCAVDGRWAHFQAVKAFDAAPADPAEAVLDVITLAFGDQALGRRHGITTAVLAALGVPSD